MKKKTYEQPQIRIIEVKAADIICTSGVPLNYDNGVEFEEYDEIIL